MKIEIIKCTCVHEYQDAVYGKWNRVMNPIGKGDKGGKDGTHRCTVCKKTYNVKR